MTREPLALDLNSVPPSAPALVAAPCVGDQIAIYRFLRFSWPLPPKKDTRQAITSKVNRIGSRSFMPF
jgi:hypothetical protein